MRIVVLIDLVGEVEQVEIVVAVGRVAFHWRRPAARTGTRWTGSGGRVGAPAAGGAAFSPRRNVVQVSRDVAVRVCVLVVLVVRRIRVGQHFRDEVSDVVVRLAHGDASGLERPVEDDKTEQGHGNVGRKSRRKHSASQRADRAAGEFALSPRCRVARKDVDQAQHCNRDDGESERHPPPDLVRSAHIEHERHRNPHQYDRQDQRTGANHPVRARGNEVSYRPGNVEPHRTADNRSKPDKD